MKNKKKIKTFVGRKGCPPSVGKNGDPEKRESTDISTNMASAMDYT